MNDTTRKLIGLAIASSLSAPVWALPAVQLTPSVTNVTTGQTVTVSVDVTDLGGQIVSAYDLDVGFSAGLLSWTQTLFGGLLGDPSLFESLQDSSESSGVVDLAELSLLADADLDVLQPGDTVHLADLEFLATADGQLSFGLIWGPGQDVKGFNNQVIIPTQVPLPGTLPLVALAGVAAWWGARRKIV